MLFRSLGASLPGAGIDGMRERALLVGGSFAVGTSRQGGAEVRLEVPEEV